MRERERERDSLMKDFEDPGNVNRVEGFQLQTTSTTQGRMVCICLYVGLRQQRSDDSDAGLRNFTSRCWDVFCNRTLSRLATVSPRTAARDLSASAEGP